MNLFKIFIPKEKQQAVTELESWTIKWSVFNKYVSSYGHLETHHKAFIKEEDADEFKRQLNEQAKFLRTYIEVIKIYNS